MNASQSAASGLRGSVAEEAAGGFDVEIGEATGADLEAGTAGKPAGALAKISSSPVSSAQDADFTSAARAGTGALELEGVEAG
jgi:hypothetical protein